MLLADDEIARVAHQAARAVADLPLDPEWEALSDGARTLAIGMTRALRGRPGAALGDLYPTHGNDASRAVFTAAVRALDA